MPPKGKKKGGGGKSAPTAPSTSTPTAQPSSSSTANTTASTAAIPTSATAAATTSKPKEKDKDKLPWHAFNKPPYPNFPAGSIGERRQKEYLASRPALTAWETKEFSALTLVEKERLPYEFLREKGGYTSLGVVEQNKFFAECKRLGVGFPASKPEPLGLDRWGRDIDHYSIAEFEEFDAKWTRYKELDRQSRSFRARYRAQREKEVKILRGEDADTEEEKAVKGAKEELSTGTEEDKDLLEVLEWAEKRKFVTEEELQEERERRRQMADYKGVDVGVYEGEPNWDDVVPLAQEEGEDALAKIAYSREYGEAISYLRALQSASEYSPRALALTAHVIDQNPAHYTVWLYRASILFALNSDLHSELSWLDGIALDNQKNYQIWHHRQLLISTLYPTISDSREKVLALARSEVAFTEKMFSRDSKNYHVWSYRQWLVRRLSLFPSQTHSDPANLPSDTHSHIDELAATETLLQRDVRNNSAWSHRFFVVFSDPGLSSAGSKATAYDAAVPAAVLDREIEFTKGAIRRAGMNMSGWNYVRGVLKKGGREVAELEAFAGEFARVGAEGEDEDVASSHALELLVDVWAERGEKAKAQRGLALLAGKYDRVRKKYWEWRAETIAAA